MILRQRFPNQWDSPLNGAVSAAATAWVVDDASALPLEGEYHVACDDEIVKVTKRVANTLTVVRAQDGTTATTHSDNRDVFTLITNDGVEQMRLDMGFDYQQPATSHPSRLTNFDGSVLTASDFAIRNTAAGTTLTDNNGTLVLESDAMGSNNTVRGAVMTTTPSNPFRCTAHLCGVSLAVGSGGDKVGIGFRGTTSAKLTTLVMTPDYNVYLRQLTSYTVWSSTVVTENYFNRKDVWVRVDWVDPDYTYYWSADGWNWKQIHTETNASWINDGTHEFGIWFGNNSKANNIMTVDAFVIEDLT